MAQRVPATPSLTALTPRRRSSLQPHPVYAYLRENAPVVKTPYGFWLLARHEDVTTLVKDRRFGKGFPRIKARYGEKYLDEPAIRSLGLMMLTQDLPAIDFASGYKSFHNAFH